MSLDGMPSAAPSRLVLCYFVAVRCSRTLGLIKHHGLEMQSMFWHEICVPGLAGIPEVDVSHQTRLRAVPAIAVNQSFKNTRVL